MARPGRAATDEVYVLQNASMRHVPTFAGGNIAMGKRPES